MGNFGFSMLSISPLILVFLWASILVNSEPFWNDLRVTWNANPKNPGAFQGLPRTLEELNQKSDFQLIPGGCQGKFLGHRYIKGNDPTVILLFDANGYIAGIQNAIPKSAADKVRPKHFRYDRSPYYELDTLGGVEFYILTIYFSSPCEICSRGRTQAEFEQEGTASRIFFQVGEDPYHDFVEVPRDQCDMLGTYWNKGGCRPNIGIHYYYNLTEKSDCTDWFPYSVNYYEGQLVCVRFVNFGNFSYTNQYDHVAPHFIKDVAPAPCPTCLSEDYDSVGIVTLHVYLVSNYKDINCRNFENV